MIINITPLSALILAVGLIISTYLLTLHHGKIVVLRAAQTAQSEEYAVKLTKAEAEIARHTAQAPAYPCLTTE